MTKPVSSREEACALAREIAWPGGRRPGVKEAIRSVQRVTGSTYRRAKALLYFEARRVSPEELELLRGANARRRRGNDADAAGNDEISALKQQIAALIRRIDKLENTPRP